MFLPKKIAWPVLILLVCLDALISYLVANNQGGSLVWRPLISSLGYIIILILLPLVFLIFYGVVKLAGWFLKKYDKLPQGEEMILTSLVIVYATYDLYLALFSRASLNSTLLIPLLLIPGLIYGLWLEYLRAQGKFNKVKKVVRKSSA